MIDAKIIDETTIRLDKGELARLKDKAAYLLAMEVRDLSEMIPIEVAPCNSRVIQSTLEATIGVIDTPFSEDVYFKDWVTDVEDSKLDISVWQSKVNSVHSRSSKQSGRSSRRIVIYGFGICP